MIDENLVFIIFITVFIIFIINKQPKVIGTLFLIIIFYCIYKQYFTNPHEFSLFIKNKVKETFEPCSISNMGYCNNDGSSSNMTFLPDILRSAIPNNSNNINDIGKVKLKLEDYTIDKRVKLGNEQISMDEMIKDVPNLLDYKTYLETVIKFVLNIKTDDTIQKDFLAKKLRYNMTKVCYNAYNTVNNKTYPINIYNELLYSQLQFNETLNIFTFLGLNEYDNNKIIEFQKQFKNMNIKLNEYLVERVNDITPNDYDITTSFLPRQGEPLGISNNDIDMNSSYSDL
jgi:hypothetical protein